MFLMLISMKLKFVQRKHKKKYNSVIEKGVNTHSHPCIIAHIKYILFCLAEFQLLNDLLAFYIYLHIKDEHAIICICMSCMPMPTSYKYFY